MPRRRIRKLPPKGDPVRAVLLFGIGRRTRRLADHLIRGVAREEARGKENRKEIIERFLSNSVSEGDKAIQSRSLAKFTPSEKSEMTAVIWKGLKERNIPEFQQIRKKLNLDKAIAGTNSLKYLWNIENQPAALAGNGKQEGLAEKLAPHVQNVFRTASYSFLLQKELAIIGISEPLERIYHVMKETGINPPPITDPEIDEKMMVLLSKTEKMIVDRNKLERGERLSQNTLANRMLSRIRIQLSRMKMSGRERKKIYSGARDRMQARSGEVGEWALARGFKQARLDMRATLQEIGFNPEKVFSETGINNEEQTGIKRLKVLTTILRLADSPEQKRNAVNRFVQKYGSKVSPSPTINSERSHPVQIRNPKKLAKELERRARREKEKRVERPLVETSPHLPTTLREYVSLFDREERITPEQANGLSKMISSIRPREHAQEEIVSALEYQILCVMATHFKKSGRVTVPGLRQITTPPVLHREFGIAIDNLMRKGLIELTHHARKTNNVSLAGSTAGRTLGKYDTKISRQRGNEKR